ncbi:hypothetical protein K0G17_19900 [Bacteroides fragilis]|nr:hypothetical protein [Bacteroides fragilis]
MFHYNQIITLLNIFDDQIYTTLSEENVSGTVNSFISSETILKYFSSREEFILSLSVYIQTIIEEKIESSQDILAYPLVRKIKSTKEGVEIIHDYKALQLYLHPHEQITILNSFIKAVFVNALSKYNLKADILYDLLTQNSLYSCTPESLKATLGINYTNSMLKMRILDPVESTIHKLYQNGELPFYISITVEKSLFGSGGKIIGVNFETNNHLAVLRLARLRPCHIQFITDKLIELLPFDYPFLEEGINQLNDKAVDTIFHMIKDIELDPDYGKIETSTLIKYKLKHQYQISVPRFN